VFTLLHTGMALASEAHMSSRE